MAVKPMERLRTRTIKAFLDRGGGDRRTLRGGKPLPFSGSLPTTP